MYFQRGLLRTESDDFLLEPVSKHLNHSFAEPMHPHIIYSRRHLQKGKHPIHYCGKKKPRESPHKIKTQLLYKHLNIGFDWTFLPIYSKTF